MKHYCIYSVLFFSAFVYKKNPLGSTGGIQTHGLLLTSADIHVSRRLYVQIPPVSPVNFVHRHAISTECFIHYVSVRAKSNQLFITRCMNFINLSVCRYRMADPKKDTEITVESVLEKFSQDYLKCSICLDTFTDPTFLDCHHTFCRSCLSVLSQSENCNRRSKITCPTCRKETSLGIRGLSGLQQNFTLVSFTEDVARQRKLLHKQQGVLICSLCDNESHATIKCIDCDESLCQDCWFCQESNHVDHEVDILNNQTATEAVPKCARHPDLDYCFYCQTCQVLLCAMCATTKHRSWKHMHVDIEQAGSTLKEELQELISEAEERIYEFIQERSLTESKRDTIEDEIAYENELTMQRDVEFKEIQGRKHVLKRRHEIQQEIVDEYSDILNDTNAKVQWATHIRDSIHKQVTEASMYKLLQMREELLMKITDVVEKTFPLIVFPSF